MRRQGQVSAAASASRIRFLLGSAPDAGAPSSDAVGRQSGTLASIGMCSGAVVLELYRWIICGVLVFQVHRRAWQPHPQTAWLVVEVRAVQGGWPAGRPRRRVQLRPGTDVRSMAPEDHVGLALSARPSCAPGSGVRLAPGGTDTGRQCVAVGLPQRLARVVYVALDGVGGQRKLLGDLPIRQPLRHQAGYFAFAGAQRQRLGGQYQCRGLDSTALGADALSRGGGLQGQMLIPPVPQTYPPPGRPRRRPTAALPFARTREPPKTPPQHHDSVVRWHAPYTR